MSVAELLRMQLEAIRDEGKILCPYCDTEYVDEEGRTVSYWGDKEEVEVTCENDGCERDFKVKEFVRRTYETRKLA